MRKKKKSHYLMSNMIRKAKINLLMDPTKKGDRAMQWATCLVWITVLILCSAPPVDSSQLIGHFLNHKERQHEPPSAGNRTPRQKSQLAATVEEYNDGATGTNDISGRWEGTANDPASGATANVVVEISQIGNTVTGKWSSPGSYPTICGFWNGDINGTLQEGTFTFTATSPVKDLETCEIECFGTMSAALRVDMQSPLAKMSGDGQDEFCLDGEVYNIYISLIRTNKTCFTYSGYHDKTTKNLALFGVTTTMIDGHPLAGGLIRFDASEVCEAVGSCDCSFHWDFDGGELLFYDRSQDKPVVRFLEPRTYNVKLDTTSKCIGNNRTCQKVIDLNLLAGDLIFIRTPGWTAPFDLVNQSYTHVGMYIGGGQMIEASLYPAHGSVKKGVHLSPLSGWANPTEPFVTAYRVRKATPLQRQAAVDFARSLLPKEVPYDMNVFSKQLYGNSYYCSELIWAAYYHAAGIDLGQTGPISDLPVHPDHIAKDTGQVTFIGGHWEHYEQKLSKQGAIGALIDLILQDTSVQDVKPK
jgi:uncharacterized protein YycO